MAAFLANSYTVKQRALFSHSSFKTSAQWSILSSYTCQQRGVLLLVLAVGLSSVLEKEGGVFHQTLLYCQEERSLTTRSAAVH